MPFSLSPSPSPSRFQVIRKHLFLSPPYAEHLLVFFPRSLALSFPLRFHKQRASLGLHMCIREASIYVCGTDWLELNSVFYWFILALGLSVALGGARSTGDDRSKRVVAVSSRESRNGRFMAASRHHRTPLGERSSDVDEENATSGLDPNICIYIYIYTRESIEKFCFKQTLFRSCSFRTGTRILYMEMIEEFFLRLGF